MIIFFQYGRGFSSSKAIITVTVTLGGRISVLHERLLNTFITLLPLVGPSRRALQNDAHIWRIVFELRVDSYFWCMSVTDSFLTVKERITVIVLSIDQD